MMCSVKFNLLSRVTPRHLKDLFHVMETLFILVGGGVMRGLMVNSVACVYLEAVRLEVLAELGKVKF